MKNNFSSLASEDAARYFDEADSLNQTIHDSLDQNPDQPEWFENPETQSPAGLGLDAVALSTQYLSRIQEMSENYSISAKNRLEAFDRKQSTAFRLGSAAIGARALTNMMENNQKIQTGDFSLRGKKLRELGIIGSDLHTLASFDFNDFLNGAPGGAITRPEKPKMKTSAGAKALENIIDEGIYHNLFEMTTRNANFQQVNNLIQLARSDKGAEEKESAQEAFWGIYSEMRSGRHHYLSPKELQQKRSAEQERIHREKFSGHYEFMGGASGGYEDFFGDTLQDSNIKAGYSSLRIIESLRKSYSDEQINDALDQIKAQETENPNPTLFERSKSALKSITKKRDQLIVEIRAIKDSADENPIAREALEKHLEIVENMFDISIRVRDSLKTP